MNKTKFYQFQKNWLLPKDFKDGDRFKSVLNTAGMFTQTFRISDLYIEVQKKDLQEMKDMKRNGSQRDEKKDGSQKDEKKDDDLQKWMKNWLTTRTCVLSLKPKSEFPVDKLPAGFVTDEGNGSMLYLHDKLKKAFDIDKKTDLDVFDMKHTLEYLEKGEISLQKIIDQKFVDRTFRNKVALLGGEDHIYDVVMNTSYTMRFTVSDNRVPNIPKKVMTNAKTAAYKNRYAAPVVKKKIPEIPAGVVAKKNTTENGPATKKQRV